MHLIINTWTISIILNLSKFILDFDNVYFVTKIKIG